MSNKTETFLERVTAGLATDPELRLDGISPFLDPRNGRRRAGARRSQAAGMRLSRAKRGTEDAELVLGAPRRLGWLEF